MPKSKRLPRMVVGHVYAVDWNDHFSCDRVQESEVTGDPFVCRSYGRLILDTPSTVTLEHDRHLSDGKKNQRVDVHTRLKADIVRVVDYGKAK